MYWRSDATFITSHSLYDRHAPNIFYQWEFKERNENARKDLNFIQRIFLYGLYERIQEDKQRYYPHERKPLIAPLISGYVKEYVMKSLPKRLRRWAEEVQKKYKFQ